MIIIEVSGGVVQTVIGTNDYDVLDWDNLLGDCYTTGDTEYTWNGLSEHTQQYVKINYPDSFVQIQQRIAEDRRISE